MKGMNEQSSRSETPQELNELLQEPGKDYSHLIRKIEKFDGKYAEILRTNYSEIWDDYIFKRTNADINIDSLFQKALPDETLVDLGGAAGRLSELAGKYKAKMYLDADLYPYGADDPEPADPTKGNININDYYDVITNTKMFEGSIKKLIVRSDMLDFASRIKDGSVNLTLNGIDSFIIKDPKYHEALANEIARAAKPGGIIFGNHSTSLMMLVKMIEGGPLRDKFEIAKNHQGMIVIQKKN